MPAAALGAWFDEDWLQGWDSFTSGASVWASQAGQGISRMGNAVQENVIRPGAAKVSAHVVPNVLTSAKQCFQANQVGNYLSDSVVQPVKSKVSSFSFLPCEAHSLMEALVDLCLPLRRV